jgi:hypothetical protein
MFYSNSIVVINYSLKLVIGFSKESQVSMWAYLVY